MKVSNENPRRVLAVPAPIISKGGVILSKYILHPKNDNTTTFSIRVKNEVLVQFEELSRKTSRSRNDLINIAMRHFIENVEVREDAGERSLK